MSSNAGGLDIDKSFLNTNSRTHFLQMNEIEGSLFTIQEIELW